MISSDHQSPITSNERATGQSSPSRLVRRIYRLCSFS
jgi:hypothetical protein